MAKSKEKAKSKKPSKSWEYFENGKNTRKICPKCGPGYVLAEHKNPQRFVCGNCYYVEHIKV